MKFIVSQDKKIELKGTVVKAGEIKNKYQTKEPECQIITILPDGFLESFAVSGLVKIKLPLELDVSNLKSGDKVEFDVASITPYSFANSTFVNYSIKAETIKLLK
ncbi:hypothetical protein [Ligilactobacillus aviarius]|uniref:Uncharacterized protein n=1 Tax=Candidatus Gallilactobacillus intestinavium TaxID=2840838 RepID=A0A9D9H5A8_9LACO|nr:hypothetical protein [Ligilactobacillus aviarius]MBO8441600.1 hypothetical protein [Candidatus Gallilactobacillus intestinavium]